MTRNPSSYGPLIHSLLANKTMETLGPGKPNESMYTTLLNLSLDALFENKKITDPEMAQCCLSAIWLYHDFLDESHTLSQKIMSPSGSYWHGIMHRREPDYANSKYWFHRVGVHPIFSTLHQAVSQWPDCPALLTKSDTWDAFGFIDLVQQSTHRDDPVQLFCQKVQHLEWQILFAYCFDSASARKMPH